MSPLTSPAAIEARHRLHHMLQGESAAGLPAGIIQQARREAAEEAYSRGLEGMAHDIEQGFADANPLVQRRLRAITTGDHPRPSTRLLAGAIASGLLSAWSLYCAFHFIKGL